MADVPAAIAFFQLAGAAHRVVLLQGLYAGRCGLMEILRETPAKRVKQFLGSAAGRPAISLMGDDDELPTGPDGWPNAARLVRWAAHVVIHAAGDNPAEYEAAIVAAQIVRRLLIIETDSAHAQAWIEMVRASPNRPSFLLIWPKEGVHPIAPDRGKMQ